MRTLGQFVGVLLLVGHGCLRHQTHYDEHKAWAPTRRFPRARRAWSSSSIRRTCPFGSTHTCRPLVSGSGSVTGRGGDWASCSTILPRPTRWARTRTLAAWARPLRFGVHEADGWRSLGPMSAGISVGATALPARRPTACRRRSRSRSCGTARRKGETRSYSAIPGGALGVAFGRPGD